MESKTDYLQGGRGQQCVLVPCLSLFCTDNAASGVGYSEELHV